MTIDITVEHDGVKYAGTIATIKSTRLGYEDHGVLTASLTCEWKGGGVSVGGFVLDEPKSADRKDYSRRGTAYGLDHIIRIIETVGVSRWEALVGSHVVVLSEGRGGLGSRSVGIAGMDNEKVLILQQHADQWRSEVAQRWTRDTLPIAGGHIGPVSEGVEYIHVRVEGGTGRYIPSIFDGGDVNTRQVRFIDTRTNTWATGEGTIDIGWTAA
jgi:hypothetical protein